MADPAEAPPASETPTQEEQPPNADNEGLALDQSATEAAAATETPEEGEEQADDEEQRELPEGWNEHPEAKKALDEHYRKAQSEFDRKLLEKDAEHNDAITTARNEAVGMAVVTELKETARRVADAIKNDGTDEAAESFKEVMEQYAPWTRFADYREEQRIRTEATESARPLIFSAASGMLYDSLPKPVQEAIGDIRDKGHEFNLKIRAGKLSTEGAYAEMVSKAVEALNAHTEKEVANMAAERGAEEERARSREGKEPVNPNGRGRPAPKWGDLAKMTPEEVAKIPKDDLQKLVSSSA